MSDFKVRVSVAMITYGHEEYIKQAIDSILMQKTDFDYEVIIGEDCSPDSTREILQDYESNYPNKFKMLYREENWGPTKNFYDVLLHCSADYIAVLEGDDFWSSPHKLQKQFDFLDKHTDFIGVVHSCSVLSNNAEVSLKKEDVYRCQDNSVFTFSDFKVKRIPGHTCTQFYRNIFKLDQYNYDIVSAADANTCDRTINMLLLAQGDIYCMKEAMSTYRLVQKVGGTNINSLYYLKNMLYKNWEYENKLDVYCFNTFGKKFLTDESVANYWAGALRYKLKRNSKEDKKIFRKFNQIIIRHPKLIINIIRKISNKIILNIQKSKNS